METIVFALLIVSSARCLSAKHVFISISKSWSGAQDYCRRYHTDLSPVSNEVEKQVLRNSLNGRRGGWVGLLRDGTAARYWNGDQWQFAYENSFYNFFCLDLIVVEEEKPWEEALEHCRENHTDLTSLLSESETLLALKEIQQEPRVTERVWIGLRFLGDIWLWVNGDPLKYEAWERSQDHQCPLLKRCGALTKEGLWESWDCSERLRFICT
ncbi:snaclec purpureotin subunit beta-like [Brachyistius frenatus]|uniref:snaclec purpureotin subunit beta-like n=1 Tax=Brachyistius frenatus TaxID=100188 RepID=UPI0037E76A4E